MLESTRYAYDLKPNAANGLDADDIFPCQPHSGLTLVGLTDKISERGVSSLLYPGLNEVMPTGL